MSGEWRGGLSISKERVGLSMSRERDGGSLSTGGISRERVGGMSAGGIDLSHS